jgi:hypothetical protein
MKRQRITASLIVAASVLLVSLTIAAQDRFALKVPNGLAFSEFKGYDAWPVIAPSYTDDGVKAIMLRPNPVLSVGGDHLDLLGTGYSEENGAGPAEFSIRTDFVFERGAKRQRRIDVAQAAVSTAQLQFLNTVRSVVLDVQSAWFKEVEALATQMMSPLFARDGRIPLGSAQDLIEPPGPNGPMQLLGSAQKMWAESAKVWLQAMSHDLQDDSPKATVRTP